MSRLRGKIRRYSPYEGKSLDEVKVVFVSKISLRSRIYICRIERERRVFRGRRRLRDLLLKVRRSLLAPA